MSIDLKKLVDEKYDNIIRPIKPVIDEPVYQDWKEHSEQTISSNDVKFFLIILVIFTILIGGFILVYYTKDIRYTAIFAIPLGIVLVKLFDFKTC